MDATQVLQSVPLFGGLGNKDIDTLGKMAHERTFGAGDSIVKEGEQGIGLYAIVSGEVEVLQGAGGAQQRLRTMGAGEVFGEMALLLDRTRTATVRATKPTECLVVTSISFREALEKSPDMARQLLQNIAGRLAEAEDRAVLGKMGLA